MASTAIADHALLSDRHFANDLDLLAEEVDPDSGELLGNFSQAVSHIGLANAAWAISEAEHRARS